jgi:Tol biopolymer transport system component
MALTSGTRLGSYDVVAQIGAGGMGEVYQAHDTKLGRDVAIKVLPEAFAHDAERLSRFQREAKMLAALNHPNIATIHGLEQSGDTSYLVMELVSGETLSDRVKRDGAVPIEETLAIAKQIAEALEAAHEKGIIHRDLKPANVKVTPEGKVKVLDFGLAKAFAGDATIEDIGNSPTLSMAATMQGVILGTAAYMSPEQARGKSVDKRTDIWAFGCVLYELLSGKASFQGEDITDILAAVVRAEPDWNHLPPSTPTKIRDLLRRCLQKDRTLRMQAAGDLRIEIHEALTIPVTVERMEVLKGVRALGRQWLIVGLGALFLVAVIASLATWNLKPSPAPPAQPVSRSVMMLPAGQRLDVGPGTGPAVVLSPDGSLLAYGAVEGGAHRLYLRAMDSLEAKAIPDTEGAVDPFFSPDGRWLGFFADGKLKKISVSGGAALTIGNTISNSIVPRGASWGSQGMIAFAPTTADPLLQVSDVGGTPQLLTRVEKGDTGYLWPEFLPGGKAVLFAARVVEGSGVAVQSIATGERRNLIPGGTQPHYAVSGHLIYAQGGNLIAAPFDPQRLAIVGLSVPVIEGVLQSPNGAAQYSISATGSLVYVPGTIQSAQRTLVWVSRNGTEQLLSAPAHSYVQPRVSPDGKRIAVNITEQQVQVWLYDLTRDTLTRFTFEGSTNSAQAWTPDGKRIAFQSTKEGPQPNLFWQMADGSGGLERLTTSQSRHAPSSWSPDGELLAYVDSTPTTGTDIWVLRLSDRKVQPFLQTPFNETAPRFSPDGHWLAYVSDESGRNEIYVQPYPGPGGKWQISTDGGTEPVWNPNGRELFYRTVDKMMAVDIVTQPSFSMGKPQMLFAERYLPTPGSLPNYDVSPDGQRFLMVKPVEQAQAAPTQINVVLNWFEELKRRVPAGTK